MVLRDDLLTSFPLTTGQSSIGIAQALDRESAVYNMGECVENREAFERALRLTVPPSSRDKLNDLTLNWIASASFPAIGSAAEAAHTT
jgi:hypothetical protein